MEQPEVEQKNGAGSLERLRRPDWLKEFQAVLILGLVLAALLGGLGVAAVVAGDSVPVQLPATGVTGTVEYGLRDGSTVAADQQVRVEAADPGLGQRAGWLFTALPTYLVIVALLVLLLRIVVLARRTDPFTQATVRRVRVLGWVALVGGIAAYGAEALAQLYLVGSVTTDGIGITTDLPLHWFPIGFGLLALAEVVKRGCAMRAELDSVV